MCGIAGIYNVRGIDLAEINTISQTLKHRGPDDEGFFLSNNEGHVEVCKGDNTINELQQLTHVLEVNFHPTLALLHRRLSIIDLSALGHQPLISADNRYVMVYNGEVYNFKEIRQELQQKGYAFNSNSDTEVVLNAFAAWGKSCVNRFVGMWAFVIYDKQENTLTLSRDRFGVKPLYYFKNEHCFAFASEIKALLKLKAVDKSVSETKLGAYLAFGTISEPYQNLFKNIFDIEPGCNYQLNLNTLEFQKEQYYSLENKLPKNISDIGSNTQKMEALFNQSIELHLISDVEVGTCLSGGLDSSAIIHQASQQLKQTQLKTITAAYHDKLIDESNYAKLVTDDLTNVNAYYTYPDAEKMMAGMEKMIYYQDLPIGSTSIFAHWEVMKCANEHQIKVLLNGQGADEILGGYYNFAGIHLIELLKKFQFNRFFKEYQLLKQNFTPQIKTAVLRAAYYYLPNNLQQHLRAKERLSYSFIKEDKLNELDLQIPKRGGKTFNEHVNLSLKFGLYELLRYEDRNSMAFSIESRVPFLDHRLVDFIRTLPTDQKIYGGWTKYILRKMLNQKLNDQVVWRKDKKGFLTPQQDWKKDVMKTLTKELKESNIPSIMDRDYILKLCDKDFSHASHLSEFWRAYSVVKWYNVFNLNV
jgi:asparagine synthase (glutamine-hydrolysing)